MKNKFKFPANTDSIAKVESLIDEVCSEYAISNKKYGNICIAVMAAVENSIIHGNKMDSEKSLNFSYDMEERQIGFVIKDEGEGFDHQAIPDPTMVKMRIEKKGRGLFLMKVLSDELIFNNSGNEVELKFKL
ncbi:ATP-binding protein [Bacteroidota bacterium]